MKQSSLASLLVGAVLLSTATAFAQQGQRINYRITNYYNVAPDKVAAMLDDARTSGRKLIQEEIASGVNITSWVLLRTAFRGVTPAINYNYAISVDFDGAPQTPNVAARDQTFRKATGNEFPGLHAKSERFSDQLRQRALPRRSRHARCRNQGRQLH